MGGRRSRKFSRTVTVSWELPAGCRLIQFSLDDPSLNQSQDTSTIFDRCATQLSCDVAHFELTTIHISRTTESCEPPEVRGSHDSTETTSVYSTDGSLLGSQSPASTRPPARHFRMILSAPGVARESTGIGVIQRNLYPRLEALGHELTLTANRDLGMSPTLRLAGLGTAFLGVPAGDVYLSLTSPLPLRTPSPVVAFVHDLRWQRTRGRGSVAYRTADLRRTLRIADRVLVNSHATASDVAAFAPLDAWKVHVTHLGPGQFNAPIFTESRSGRLLLMGGASHKRNELAVEALAEAQVPWISEIVTVGVNAHTVELLGNSPYAHEAHGRVSSSVLSEILRGCQYFMHLGLEEGFGLPYVEALAHGCEVVAIEQPLTLELLADAAALLHDGPAGDLAGQLRQYSPVPAERRRLAAGRFSWERFAEQIASHLQAVL